MMVMPMPIGERLRELREAAGMTQQDVAQAAGLSVSLVAQMERGATGDPKLSTMRHLARALRCKLDDLVPADEPLPDMRKRRRTPPKGGRR